MKGGAHIGALRAIQEVQGSLEFPDGIYGSSIGAVIAVAIAFNIPMETIQATFTKYHKLSYWLPSASVKYAFSMMDRKGFFSMNKLREILVSIYTECGIKDIETKRICDAPQPLFILASNMTRRKPAILTGEVPILDAVLCSCCIPGLFEPQVLYGEVYLDGAVYVRYVEQVIPPETLAFQLMGRGAKITPKSSLGDILYACWCGTMNHIPSKNVCCFRDIKVGILEDIADAEREALYELGHSQTLAFLSKRVSKHL